MQDYGFTKARVIILAIDEVLCFVILFSDLLYLEKFRKYNEEGLRCAVG